MNTRKKVKHDSFLLGCTLKSLQSLLKMHSRENTDKSGHRPKGNEQSNREHDKRLVLLCNVLGSEYFLLHAVFMILSDFVLLQIGLEIGTSCLRYTYIYMVT